MNMEHISTDSVTTELRNGCPRDGACHAIWCTQTSRSCSSPASKCVAIATWIGSATHSIWRASSKILSPRQGVRCSVLCYAWQALNAPVGIVAVTRASTYVLCECAQWRQCSDSSQDSMLTRSLCAARRQRLCISSACVCAQSHWRRSDQGAMEARLGCCARKGSQPDTALPHAYVAWPRVDRWAAHRYLPMAIMS